VNLKINTALFISLAFVFRLLFVNVALFFASQSQASHVAAAHFSDNLKRRKNFDQAGKSDVIKFSAVEICEENPDNVENHVKGNIPVLLSFLSLVKSILLPVPGNIFNSIKCSLFPRTHLALSILRI